ncbi:catechol 2,3-dioxygenase [Branchiibius hedensis]|uniref:Catechol 2,3-dioxygenase n=1 Tax=Branchiibius hedensis TaxID=672460 RepID=A0A2Y8ZUP1_9MICO|nr:VOC family protein [Branchiibius hedensis]PWJ26834.1 catechol 2,3-dioxygenase [Branchiibius hedensis]SSA35645.1 catechol 2,3-dioxygenase [Branchiibius hedensis]
MSSPRGQIAHLGYAELRTPDLDGTVWFFENILGMTTTYRDDLTAHVRTFDDYEQTSIVIRNATTSGIGRLGLRCTSDEALDARVADLVAAGREGRWEDGLAGTGRTFVTSDPDGHEIALYFDTTWYQAPEELRPGLKNQPQAKPNRGVGVRRFDHINFLASDVEAAANFHTELLGARVTEQIQMDDGRIAARWMTYTNKSYDVVYTEDWTGSNGRLHHLAFATENREDILRAADLCLDNGVPIETGPHKHAIQQTFFLYVFEPGGNRIELCNPLTRLVLAPDWKVVTWTEAERAKGQAWGLKTIESFHTYGTPPLESAKDFTYTPGILL